MAINFTPEQQQVIELHNKNILVSAAAGSGKTAVLVERIIRMVCDKEHPVDIDRLLIVTFTNAAAAEMRERIAKGIALCLQQDPENEHIQKQSTLLHNAQITTIDSFSLFLIRNHFNEIGLDPTFRVADEGEIKLLQQEVLGQLLEEAFASEEEAFRFCVEYFCPGGREKVLEQHILNLSKYAASFPWPEEWLLERKEDYAVADVEALSNSKYGQYLSEHISRLLEGCAKKLRSVQKICESPDGPYMYGELIDNEIEQLEQVARYATLEEYAARVPSISFGRLPTVKDDSVSAIKREKAKSLRAEVKETLRKMTELFFTTPLELAVSQGLECAAPVGTLIDLVVEFDRRMKERKQERKLIDFSDMEHYALDILLRREDGQIKPSPIALEYRQYFHEILIDEYQDSNLVQEYLLQAVSGEDDGQFNRFMVGDVKQSIYKFRLARPEIFLEKYDTYQVEGDCRRIDLSKNFRSRQQVVDTVNEVFGRIMSRDIGGIDYDDRAALYVGADYPPNEDCDSELLLVEKPGKGEEWNAKQAEALAIAQKIKQLCTNFKVTDKDSGQLRPARYKDMVILLRTNSGWDEEFKMILEQEGIPVYITSKTGYFAATEIQELLQLLRVLDNPRQDIALYSVMKSIFGGFNEEEIAAIRSGHKGCSLYEALQQCQESDEQVQGFLDRINTYRDYTTYMPIRELLQKLVEDCDYLNYVTALPGGSKRRANVEMLFTKASDFEKTSYFGLFHFIRYMEQLEKYDVDYGEADVLDENADVVRIMSIHKSKGLEFPITFVSGLAKRFNMQDVNQTLIVDMDMGVACDYINPVKRIRNKTLRRVVLSRKMREDNLSEELRVLYVALTRAKEKLILTATLEKACEKWEIAKEGTQENLSYLDFVEATGYLDVLLPILPYTQIKVSVQDMAMLLGENLKEQIELGDKRNSLEHAKDYADMSLLQQLEERFAYVYPHARLQKLYTKTTVSELKIAAMAQKDEAAFHAFEEKEVVPYIPTFRREKEAISGTVRGNAFHRVMELLDFERLLGTQFAAIPVDYQTYRSGLQGRLLEQELSDFLQEEQSTLRLTAEYAGAVKPAKILHFLQSEVAYRMWRAERRGQLYREQPFVLGISAGRLGEDFPEDEKVLIQGIIDVFFVEDGEIVLLDYKTDVINSMQDLKNRYAVQLDYYEEALQKLMKLPVKEKLLYSFYLEEY
ncbi:MAG: helicase-exonuclease AddAB subunit AddA [Lachnospiraceae bacterium]|nr:helicase-exonuclease AddAB subunit AddA [Lachnospiraceae bacterium]